MSRVRNSAPAGSRVSGNFYGRRKTKALSARQQDVYDRLAPSLRIDLHSPPPRPLTGLFPVSTSATCLEIGFGGGEHLIGQAMERPDRGFIGAEPFVNGVARMLREVEARNLRNIRLYDADATDLLAWLPDESLERIDLLYPDPWPKKRHWKRRFVNRENIRQIARVLAPGGEFRFASDIDDYVNWTLLHCRDGGLLRWTARRADDWRQPWAGWSGTRYEAKAIREGRIPGYLRFEKASGRT